MTTRCYTSFTLSYLAKARVLAESVHEHHPDWEVWAMVCEPLPPSFDLENEPFDAVLTLEDLELPGLAGWVFSHSVVEVCTGVKGAAMHRLLTLPDTEAVLYLDPDVAVFHPLIEVERALERGSIVLTPHQLAPEIERQAVIDNEMTSLVHGVYNLGFVAVRADAQGIDFAAWWRERLIDFCFDDRMSGLFTDQRWCDFVPVYFDRHVILRLPAYNVGPWNVGQRNVTRAADGTYLVDGDPLVFFHFSGFDGSAGRRMLNTYAQPGSAVFDLWAEYESLVVANGQTEVETLAWPYLRFDDGSAIDQLMRDAYRYRPDVRAAFADPFCVDRGLPSFREWWDSEGLQQWATR